MASCRPEGGHEQVSRHNPNQAKQADPAGPPAVGENAGCWLYKSHGERDDRHHQADALQRQPRDKFQIEGQQQHDAGDGHEGQESGKQIQAELDGAEEGEIDHGSWSRAARPTGNHKKPFADCSQPKTQGEAKPRF